LLTVRDSICILILYWVFSVFAVISLLPVVTSTPLPSSNDVPPSAEAPPAAFSVSDLSIEPAEVEPDEEVTISALVTNTGGSQGSYQLVLMINGKQEEDETVTIPAGSSQSVTFNITGDEAGSYTVAVDGLSGSFTVTGNQKGNLAIDFQLKNLVGETVSLNELRGSPVMLNFWASWCGPCRSEMPLLQQIYDEYKDKGLVILAINIREDLSTVRQFMQSNNLSFPVLLDANGSVALKYNAARIPTTYFIDKDGIIQSVPKVGTFSSKAEIEQYLELILP